MSDGAGRRFFGGLLIAVGLLIATLSGLCSLGFVAMTLGPALRGPAVGSNLGLGVVLVGVFGGVPFALGAGLVIAGRAILRVKEPPPLPPPPSPPPGFGSPP